MQADPTIYQSKQAYLVQFGRRDGVIWLESGSGRNSDLALCARYDLQEDSAGEADAYIYICSKRMQIDSVLESVVIQTK